ncbi:MAG: GNAT family N-acetyltransferase [Tannerellaceae bacterium]|jgi:hypothetical protein|nr:GNAT family N-acetyltransferase [Tannerellaceae bacterium]
MTKEERKEHIIRLWKETFFDTEDFVRFYFDNIYRDGNTLTVEREDRVLSALQILPYRMTFLGAEIPVAYIAGASTLPSEQGKGHMTGLLAQADLEIRRRRIPLSILIPAGDRLFDYYRARGYFDFFSYSLHTCNRSAHTLSGISVERRSMADKEAYTYFDSRSRLRPISVLHTYDDFRFILRDLELEGGDFLVAVREDGSIGGMAFAGHDGFVREILSDSEGVKECLLDRVAAVHNLSRTTYRTPSTASLPSLPYGMARITDRELLGAICRKADIDVLHLTSRAAYISLMLE